MNEVIFFEVFACNFSFKISINIYLLLEGDEKNEWCVRFPEVETWWTESAKRCIEDSFLLANHSFLFETLDLNIFVCTWLQYKINPSPVNTMLDSQTLETTTIAVKHR